MSDTDQLQVIPQDDAGWLERDRAALRRKWGWVLAGMAALDLLLLAAGILSLLPGARESGDESWRGALIVLGIQTGVTVLPCIFIASRLLRQQPNDISIRAVWSYATIIVFDFVSASLTSPNWPGIVGLYEFMKFTRQALFTQMIMAVLVTIILWRICRKPMLKGTR